MHVVALFLEQMSPGLPTAVQTFLLSAAFRKDADLAPDQIGSRLNLRRTNVISSTAVD